MNSNCWDDPPPAAIGMRTTMTLTMAYHGLMFQRQHIHPSLRCHSPPHLLGATVTQIAMRQRQRKARNPNVQGSKVFMLLLKVHSAPPSHALHSADLSRPEVWRWHHHRASKNSVATNSNSRQLLKGSAHWN